MKKVLCLLCSLMMFVAIVGCSIRENNDESDYYNSPEYYQNTYESCHSTYQHKQALYSYDINNDNYLSEYELELFANAHPSFVQDKEFVAWVEGMLGG